MTVTYHFMVFLFFYKFFIIYIIFLNIHMSLFLYTTCESPYFIFNLISIFVIFVQFYLKLNNFVLLEIETIFNFYNLKLIVIFNKNVNFNKNIIVTLI